MKRETKKHYLKLAALGALAAGTAAIFMLSQKNKQEDEKESDLPEQNNPPDTKNRKAYFVGGGLGNLAGAAYLIRDCHFKGESIHIFEGLPILGGSNDGTGNPKGGFVCRGGRMLNEETYENFWELFSSIPSAENPNRSVTEEILLFDAAHPTHARARLVDKEGKILDVKSMGFNQKDRMALAKLMMTPEEKLDYLTIQDWFHDTPHFFETNFWYMWQTTFAFQKWSSLFEFKRYMERMIFEFSRIETLEGVTRTPYNQYESVIVPLKSYLESYGVQFHTHTTVTDIDFKQSDEIIVTAIHIKEKEQENEQIIYLKEEDLCFMTNACMTDSATLGDLDTPAPAPSYKPISGELWTKVASKKSNLGNPYPFFGKPDETNWLSFTVTCKGNEFLKMIEHFSGNVAGNGALMTFKDSNWLMSIVVAAQPHFKNQSPDTTIFWGYALHTNRTGDYVKKAMKDCSGREILYELIHHLHFEKNLEQIMDTVINVIPCMMPYVDAQFQPRAMNDRPHVVPENSKNFAMVSQFVEIPKDMVFTEEYSVRAARIAVYTLMNVKKPICPVTAYQKDSKVLWNALKTSYR